MRNIEIEIEDIFVAELKDFDSRYELDIYSEDYPEIEIVISKWSLNTSSHSIRTFFEIEDIEEAVFRILNYMSSMGYTDTYITCKLRSMDPWKELIIEEGNYTRYVLGPHLWRFTDKISRLKIRFFKFIK